MECVNNRKNIYLSSCNNLFALAKYMLETPAEFSFTAEELADPDLLKAAIQDLLVAEESERGYLWPSFRTYENQSEEAIYEDTPLGRTKVRDGQYRFMFGIRENMCVHKAMFTHRTTGNRRVYLIDNQRQMLGTEDSEGNLYGLLVSMIDTQKMQFSDGSVSTKSPIVVDLEDNLEIDENGALVAVPFINQLKRVVDVVLAISGTPSATTIRLTVKAACDGTNVAGLVAADFSLIDNSDGNTHAISSVAYADGIYTLTGVDFEDSVLSLDPPATLSIKAYEALNSLAINIA